jgi:hypothetical protein
MQDNKEFLKVKVSTEREILSEVVRQLKLAVPPSFELEIAVIESGPLSRAEALIDMKFLDKPSLRFAAQIKTTIDRSGLLRVMEAATKDKNNAVIIAARYISLPAQQQLKKLGICFADATGNIFIAAPRLGLLISNRGMDMDPWRKPGRPKASLTGVSTELVIRTLVDMKEPYLTAELARESGTSRGSVYWVLDRLEEVGFITRSKKSLIEKVEWQELLRAWSAESDFFKTSTTTSYVAPRGLEQLIADLKTIDKELYAATGTIAAASYHSSAGLYTAMLYSSNPEALANKLGIRQTDRGANVLLAYPNSTGPFQRTTEFEGVRIVSAPQTYRDLMSGPGRNPEEAKNLLDWMVLNDGIWRK